MKKKLFKFKEFFLRTRKPKPMSLVFYYEGSEISSSDLNELIENHKHILKFTLLPTEIIDVIFNFVNDGKTYKAILQTCKYFYNGHNSRKNNFCNQLWTLIMKYPKKKWHWVGVSMNPNITMDIIEKHMSANPYGYPEKPWDWDYISHNPNLTIEFIEKYPKKPWNWAGISSNKFGRK